MGIWNSTCMITGLPIKYGSELNFAFIVKNHSVCKYPSGCGYSDDIWSLATPILKGEDDTYGGVDNLDDFSVSIVKKIMSSTNITIADDDYYNTDISNMSIVEFIRAVERDLVKYDGKPVGLVLMLNEAVDFAIKNGSTYKSAIVKRKLIIDCNNEDVWKELSRIVSYLDGIRAVIGPRSGKGGQTDEYSSYIAHSKFVSTIASELKDEIEEDMNEYW